jgi:hypothetical protein
MRVIILEKRTKEQVEANLNIVRDRLHTIHDRTAQTLDALEPKLVNYLNTCKSIPSVETASLLIGALNGLYKSNMDANTTLLKSYEKEIDVQIKLGDTEDETNVSLDSIREISKMQEKFKEEREFARSTHSLGGAAE